MRARSAGGTPRGSAGAPSPPAPGAGRRRATASNPRPQASAKAGRLFLEDAESATATSRGLRIAVAPGDDHVEGRGGGSLLDDDVDEVRRHHVGAHADHGADAVTQVKALGDELVPDVAARFLEGDDWDAQPQRR